MRLLYLTAEQWPTFRADLVALFGKYLPRYGLTSDLVTERDFDTKDGSEIPWGGGQAILCDVPAHRAAQYLVKFLHDVRVMISMDAGKYAAIQVRDMGLTGLAGLVVAKIKGVKFFYWLSYPQSEGQVDRAKKRGIKAGMKFWFPLLQGSFGKWLLYKIILPRADHVFVQSQQMQLDLAKCGVPMAKMTPVPMGVDTETTSPDTIFPIDDPQLQGKRVVVYLGTLDRVRQIDVLFHMLAIVKQTVPDILLVLVGDTEEASHREWLKQEAERVGVAEHILWTGWLASDQAWRYVRAAEVGLSPFPRSFLLDSASPTKAIEYMALGLPVIVNDNPDQAQVIAESEGGVCVPLEPSQFAEALVALLADPARCEAMGKSGKAYVSGVRNYQNLAKTLAGVYFKLGQK